MLKLYFAPKSRAVRAAWMLEELGLDENAGGILHHVSGEIGLPQMG